MAEPLPVIGSQGQLEQVFLNLLIQAEQSLATAPEKVVTVRTSLLARRVLIEIEYTAGRGAAHDEAAAALEGLTHSVMAAHGGEVRLVRMPAADPRFEVELPWAAKERSLGQPRPAATPVRSPGRQRTALVIESDSGNQRQLLALLSARGFRVVPVDNADTGLELTQRLRFDLAFCSVHSPGLNWVELSERLQSRVGAFVLLSDGYAPELAADFEGDGRFVLPRPVQEAELDGLIASLEPVTVARVRTA
jgi:CheY-like chemotaxis protein